LLHKNYLTVFIQFINGRLCFDFDISKEQVTLSNAKDIAKAIRFQFLYVMVKIIGKMPLETTEGQGYATCSK